MTQATTRPDAPAPPVAATRPTGATSPSTDSTPARSATAGLSRARARRGVRWLDRQETGTRHALRRLAVVLALVPLLLLLATRIPDLVRNPWIVAYGVGVLSMTILLFYRAYAHYDDLCDPVRSRVRDIGAPPLPAVPSVTLIVAAMNEIDVIDQCVRSMTGSDYPNLQVIVVDDASDDGTTERLRDLAPRHGFLLVTLPTRVGKKRALVAGLAHATGDVIAFTDSDCVLDPAAVRRCTAALVAHPGLGAVSGHARALNPGASLLTKVQDTWYEGSFRVTKAAESTFGSVTCVSGPLAVFRRDAIWNYLPAWAEDRFLGAEFRFATDRQLTGYVLGQAWVGEELKARHADSPHLAIDHPVRRWSVGYVRSARVWTVVPERLRPFLRQQVRWKKSFVRNLCFSGRFMWRRGLGPSVVYYGHALWVAAAPAMATFHLVWAPLQGWWLLTLLYLCGVLVKGAAWSVAYALDNPGDPRWKYRPLMSLISSTVLSWLLPYALLTIRRGVWARSAT